VLPNVATVAVSDRQYQHKVALMWLGTDAVAGSWDLQEADVSCANLMTVYQCNAGIVYTLNMLLGFWFGALIVHDFKKIEVSEAQLGLCRTQFHSL
jgi:hypothetical protein